MDSTDRLKDMVFERFKEYSRLTAYKSGVDAGYNKKLNEIPEFNAEGFTDGLMVGMGITEEGEFAAEVDRIESEIYPLSLKDLNRKTDLNKFTGLDTMLHGIL